jgi:dTDP-4-amino-4,6-dideoxygalactose transaminase
MSAGEIPLAVPSLDGNAAGYVQQCLEDNLVSSVGPFVERFEREFAAAVGARHAVACASGTAALHVALRLAGAGPGTLVAVPAFTFIASANAVAYTGAQPWLVDSERATWNLDAERLHDEVCRRAAAGRPLPAAIEAVHVLGHPAQLEPLLDLRARFGIPLVEDAAEALGASYTAGALAGRQVGAVGDLGCFSFNGNKTITTGGGGMIVTDDADLARRARHLTTQAKLPGPAYVHDEVGYNYRLTNLAAALGVAQLERLPVFLAAKRAVAGRYRRACEGLPVTFAPHAPWAEPSSWLSCLLLDDPEPVVGALAANGVQARRLWPPLWDQAPYRDAPRLGGGVADELSRRGLSLPSSVGLTEHDQARVVAALRAALTGASRSRPPDHEPSSERCVHSGA